MDRALTAGIKTLTFDVSIPPSTNHLFATRKGGKGRIKTKAYTLWRNTAGWEINTQRMSVANAGLGLPGAAPASVYILVPRAEVNSARDLDNMTKPILDLLVHMKVLEDDNIRHVELVCVQVVDQITPSVTVQIQWRAR